MLGKFINVNAVHNGINLAIILLTTLVAFDWASLGMAPETALKVTGALAALKVVMNVARDGLTGLTKVQPPVEAPPDPMQSIQ